MKELINALRKFTSLENVIDVLEMYEANTGDGADLATLENVAQYLNDFFRYLITVAVREVNQPLSFLFL